MSDTRPAFRLDRRICLGIMAVAIPALLYLELAKPIFTADEVLQPLIAMTLTRAVGAVVFLALLLTEGYRVLNPIRKPFWRSILWALPAILVVINNLPALSMLWGDAYLIYKEPRYIVWFTLECLAIGLFEELAFRGVILLMFAEKRRRTRKGLFISIMLTSAVFGAVHLVNLLAGSSPGAVFMQIGYSFLIGAMCAVVLFKTANLWLCVALHAVFDFCGQLMPTLGGGTWWDTPTVVFTAVLAVATTVYLVWQFFRMDVSEVERIYEK